MSTIVNHLHRGAGCLIVNSFSEIISIVKTPNGDLLLIFFYPNSRDSVHKMFDDCGEHDLKTMEDYSI